MAEETRSIIQTSASQSGVVPQAMTAVAQSRAAQEVQAAIMAAKCAPRNEAEAEVKILEACKRYALADVALYKYPRGGKVVTGPSIRLAETMARYWGNVDFGTVEVEQRNGASTMMSYCWDLETNVRATRTFVVPHTRFTKSGSYALEDPRDIYERTANDGARRLRAAILAVIPGHIVDAAREQCAATIAAGGGKPMADRIREMVKRFHEIGVNAAMIETRLGHKIDIMAPDEMVEMAAIYRSIKDGVGRREDFFGATPTEAPAGTGDAVAEKIRRRKSEAAKPEAPRDDESEGEGDAWAAVVEETAERDTLGTEGK